MKIVNVLVVFILAAFIFTSCQKELDFGNFQSAGTLKSDTLFDCLPSSVHGTYTENSVLTDTNYIEVEVNVSLSGNYLIQSDTVNGYSFRGTGNFSTTGLNTVRLYASGTPLLPGPNSFIVSYDTTSFCIIEVDVEAAAGAAEFTYGGSGGTCTGGGVGGSYMVGTAMTSSNTDTINVDVITLGSYSITTGAVNGITFSLTGTFTTLGPQTVILQASGTPAADGTFNFPVSGGSSTGCAFSVTVQPAAPPAVFTVGSGGVCTGATLTGTYQATIPVIPQNTATITVDVTTVGSYTITTAPNNGITFSASGVFTATGPQPVVLTASGTPTAAGTVDFTVTGGSTTCTFPLTFDAAPTGNFHCKIDGVYYNFGNNAYAQYDGVSVPTSSLSMHGININNISLIVSVNLDGSNGTVAATTYINDLATLSAMNLIGADYTDISAMNWLPATSPPLDAFTITITSLTATNVQGTFSGPLHDQFGAGPNMVTISEGAFDLPIQ